MTSMIETRTFVRRRSGTVAAVLAIAGFTVGAAGTFQLKHAQPLGPILLRQATESDPMISYDAVPGAGGMLVLLRNDSALPVQVVDAAFARTSAAPPLYVAPETVRPGAEVNVYVPVPGSCFAGVAPGTFSAVAVAGSPPKPIEIKVSARLLDGPTQSIQVEVVGEVAAILDACHAPGSG
jgi:hypothetical protein